MKMRKREAQIRRKGIPAKAPPVQRSCSEGEALETQKLSMPRTQRARGRLVRREVKAGGQHHKATIVKRV